jgi:hypothetical protein
MLIFWEVKANISQSWNSCFHSHNKLLGRTKEDGRWIKFRPLGRLAKRAHWEAIVSSFKNIKLKFEISQLQVV